MNATSRLLLAAALCALAVGCSKKVRETPQDTSMMGQQQTLPPPPPQAAGGAYGPSDLDSDACLRQRVLYFDLDRDNVRPEFQNVVACHAKYLRDRPSARLNLEGHADERGSREYNMGLGERRANAVTSAVQANGGNGSQIEVISYGEERPVCREAGEDCWSRNRRVELIYSAR